MPSYAALLPELRAIARAAGAATLEVYRKDFTVLSKDDNSPVTEADVASERVILDGLRKLTPDIPVIAEEEVAAGRTPVHQGRFWLVDPLDGTKEFIKKNGQFTVNIGLVENGVPVAGALYVPVTDRLYAAADGQATLSVENGAPHPIKCRKPVSSGLVVLASASHRDAEPFDKFIARFPVAEIKRAGSALKYAILAEGEADIYPRFGRTMEWDTAAGHAILNAAGGCLTLVDGTPLTYGKPGYDNPAVLAWGTPQPYLDGRVPAQG
ncbi:MAG TPA: 3'(2'),5'-bisphosphate nucleotidase CysQ [Magnetospirillaceae bacterium]|jgi:3'(2'), 5'-bisphosphate nucleotidase